MEKLSNSLYSNLPLSTQFSFETIEFIHFILTNYNFKFKNWEQSFIYYDFDCVYPIENL